MITSFRSSVIVKRRAAGTLVNGNWTEGAESTLTILASIQPLRPAEMESLPEGRRTSKAFKLFTSDKLNLVSSASPDRVTLYGESYEVFGESVWQNHVIDHYKYIVIREIES